jgi:signal transduction histidine kinase/CheY-like chemotaxis protein
MRDWQNIGRKLPLLTTVLLLIAVTIISSTAYREMKRTVVTAESDHLLSVSRQLAGVFAESETRLRREGTPLSHDSLLRAALVTADPTTKRAALEHIEQRAHTGSVFAIELWDAHGTRVLASNAIANDAPSLPRSASAVAPLIVRDDTVLTDVRVPVLGETHDTLGFVRELSRVSSSQSKQLLGGLIGGRAVLLVGNATGDVWTDLDKRVDGAAVPHVPGSATTAGADGVAWIGALSSVAGTPWMIWVARPESDVIERAHVFLLRMVIVALIVVVVGAFGAHLLSGHIIAPLADLTHAAETMAHSDYSIRVATRRGDEVGRLGEAFNTMAASIETASMDLENQQVELEAQQAELQASNEELRRAMAEVTSARSAAEKLEAQLIHSQKMEAIGRLAGGVAHDFNNMLTVMISYTDLVLSEQTLADPIRADLVQVRSAADRAAGLTRQLLAFSRKQVLRPVVLDVNEVVGSVITMLARVMPESIRLSSTLGTSLDTVFVDRGQLEQVLMNLAVNARDAMPDGGSLSIETANTQLDETYAGLHGGSTGAHVVLSIRDTGSGMDAVTRERIFEPFFTTKPVGHGTGLGLATVYGIVQQSGGSIYVYSEPGQGTIFKVYFPAHQATSEERVESVTLRSSSEELTVLLVEDDPAVRDATRAVLKSLGHIVSVAADVATALDRVRAGIPFDVVITDAVMPGQSGLQLAEILAAERPDLPIVLMSGYAEETIKFDPSRLRGVLFIEKPFTAPIIAHALVTVRGMVPSVRVGDGAYGVNSASTTGEWKAGSSQT